MVAIGTRAVCWCTKLPRPAAEMDSFLLSLEVGGVVIVLIGLRRERWLRRRRR